MKNILTIISIGFSVIVQGQWVEQSTLTNVSSQKFNFITDDLGYSLGTTGSDTKILKTNDGGVNWMDIDLPTLIGVSVSDYHFYEDGHGVLLYQNSSIPTQPILLYQTFNDGLNWTDITPDTTNNGNWGTAVHFVNDNVGFFGATEILYRTIDGGATWSEYNVNGSPQSFLSYAIQDVHFYDENNGIMGFWDESFFYGGAMYVTSNGGDTWKQTFLLNKPGTVTGKVIHASETTAYAAPVKWGSYGYLELYKSTNSGATWDTIFVPDTIVGSKVTDFDFYDADNGIIVMDVDFGSGYVLYNTADGGDTWHHCGNIQEYGYEDVELTENSGFITGTFESFFTLSQGYGLSIPEQSNEQVLIYPNPTRTEGMISFNDRNNFNKITIINVQGKTVYETSLSESFIQLPNLSPGIYLVQFSNNETNETTRLVIE